ncbi:MAG: 4Fe-4S dicluster domain-containing protein [Clostridia bacterium]|nr:4Fe-4S dicluster domain-containing protein [Clostridia bacterium]
MQYVLKIRRRTSSAAKPYWQRFVYETDLAGATVATALSALNDRNLLTDIDGSSCTRIAWDCGCLQKKCGACAMVICGSPALACNVRLAELKAKEITVEPLRKFPVVADLIVDRSILRENLQTIRAWLTADAPASEQKNDVLYEASRCLQCGCCLEICPNFSTEGKFFGMAAMAPTTRLLTALPKAEAKMLREQYRRHVYAGCGKSLACRNVCPAGIDIEKLLVNSNALAIWKKYR